MTMPPTCFVNWMELCSKFQLLASASKCFGGNGRFHSVDFESFLRPETIEDDIEDAHEVQSEEEDE